MRLRALADWTQEQVADCPKVGLGPRQPDIPGPWVLLTPYGGGGFNTEQVFSNRPIQVRAVGEQEDWDGAEALAQRIDRLYTFSWPTALDGAAIKRVLRVGSEPYPLETDKAGRTHFVCSYLWDIESVAIA